MEKIIKLQEDFLKKHNFVLQHSDQFYYKNGIALTWENAKSKLGEKFLKKYFKFRKEFVDGLITYIQTQKNCLTSGEKRCYVNAAGSTNYTSDYDVTVSGSFASAIVEEFNELFLSIWNHPSGIIFDTNLYGNTYFIIENTNYSILGTECSGPSNKLVKVIDTYNDSQFIADQLSWAMCKIIVHVRETDDHPGTDLTSGVMEYLGEQLPGNLKVYFKQAKQMFQEMGQLNMSDLAVMNQKYEEMLEKMDEKRAAFEAVNFDIDLAREFKNSVATSNFYGNETYFTEGALGHTVGVLQKLIPNYPLNVHLLITSILENYGDFIKELYHEQDPQDAFVHSSKYLGRIANAVYIISERDLLTHTSTTIDKLDKSIFLLLQLVKGQLRTNIYNRQSIIQQLSQIQALVQPSQQNKIIQIIQNIQDPVDKTKLNQDMLAIFNNLTSARAGNIRLKKTNGSVTFAKNVYDVMLANTLNAYSRYMDETSDFYGKYRKYKKKYNDLKDEIIS